MSVIDPLPPPPDPSDSLAVFNSKAFAFWGAMPDMREQINVVVGEVNTNATNAATSAATATTKAAEAYDYAGDAAAAAAAAATSAGAAPWASGNYNAGQAARSTVDYRIYVARTTGGKPTDPSADATNWALASGNDLQLIAVTGTSQTAAVNGRYVLKNAAATTLTAPPSPQVGDQFAVKWTNGRYDNVINWNSAKHESSSDATLTLNGSPRGALRFVYIDATVGWGAIA